jgi:hypothetical protein
MFRRHNNIGFQIGYNWGRGGGVERLYNDLVPFVKKFLPKVGAASGDDKQAIKSAATEPPLSKGPSQRLNKGALPSPKSSNAPSKRAGPPPKQHSTAGPAKRARRKPDVFDSETEEEEEDEEEEEGGDSVDDQENDSSDTD